MLTHRIQSGSTSDYGENAERGIGFMPMTTFAVSAAVEALPLGFRCFERDGSNGPDHAPAICSRGRFTLEVGAP
jgi:hypothetical protein